ncbi:MAG: peptidoglycan-associated lipoprotein Pal [Thiobacillaceae bacterium]|nr:peptidoglycan-associated lipoprotein Pal [Thiobacillaceae bacterium]
MSIALLAGLALAACSELPKDVPIEDREGQARIGTATTVVDAGQAPATTGIQPGAAAGAAGATGASGTPASVVETRALPAAGAEASNIAVGAAGPGQGGAAVLTPGAHKDPAGPLAKRVIHFEFDSAVIAGEYQPLIETHAGYLKANKEFKVILQGHADERGSREYNLALGQRRSESVRQAMTLLGVPDEQIEAVSLGEEKPAVEGHDESAWKMNRRAEIHYQGE